jgi:indole-3-glycerol phosphate synthase
LNQIKELIENANLYEVKNLYEKLKKNNGISIIAEIKKASPSKGLIRENFNLLEIARDYYESKVEAVSILTEKKFFLGNDEYLKSVRDNFPLTILRKDFIIDEWQIYQSRIIGADAILLIAAILNDEELKDFSSIADGLGLACLVEVHDEEELNRVLNIGSKIIGINNRNLKSFDVSLKITERLIKFIPKDKIIVSESGIKDKNDIKYLKTLGVNAVLIGESFMRTNSIKEAVNDIRLEC